MDEQALSRLIRDAIGSELKAIREDITAARHEIAEVKDKMKSFITKEDAKAFATKEDLKAFATKEDLKAFATKEDLKAFATKEDLKAFATKEDFLEFEGRLSSTVERIREGVRLSLIEVEQELRDIKSKLRFYDFDYIARQNDAMIKILKDLYEEKTIISGRIKEHGERIEVLEAMIGKGK
ncbi:MAG: hypothetical protein OHK0032_05260 [Thermodesulfovibrionales bacterium]